MRLYKAEMQFVPNGGEESDENPRQQWERWYTGLMEARSGITQMGEKMHENGSRYLRSKVYRVELKTSPLKGTLLGLLNKDGITGDVYVAWSSEPQSEKMAIGKEV